jgi:hypothetical protein
VGSGGGGGGDMFKSVYDANADNIVDHAALADTAPWTGITGKPSTFAPATHGATHLVGGSDPIALATTVLAGLCPAVDNTTIQIVASRLSAVSLAWTAITGKPSTFPPDNTAMLKATYDVNGNGKVDGAETADSVAWTGITGKPATFPPDATAMLKSVYDTNANNKVDSAENADAVPWTGVSGKPATFPPDSTAMLKSVYDTNADNIVDQAAAVPWAGITGKPSTFAPTAHGTTHLDNGSDVVPVVTTVRTGLVPKLSGDPLTFLNGNGVFSAVSGSGTVDPGVWTAFTYQSGWNEFATARYRLETKGAITTVYCKGAIRKASGTSATLALIFPAGFRPATDRQFTLCGYETSDQTEYVIYHGFVDTSGNLNIRPMAKYNFVWALLNNQQTVFLDGVFFEL